jgi:hypothetical protein
VLPASEAHDLESVEAVVLGRCTYPYIATRVVYEDWLPRFDAFDTADAEGTQWAERLRADCCRIRVEQPGAFVEKSPLCIVQHQLPFLVRGPAGFSSIAQRWEHLEPAAAADLHLDLTIHDVHLRVADFFFESGRFTCTLAGTCNSAVEACREGIERTASFPAAPGCSVRDWLEASGASLGDAGA